MTAAPSPGGMQRLLSNFPFPKFLCKGSTSGSTELRAAAVASGVLTLPAATDTLVGRATTDTLTNKTLTSPTINGGTVAGVISQMRARTSAAVTANATTTYADVTGLTFALVAGATYHFRAILPSTVASGTGGIKYAFNYTGGASLTSLESTAKGFTASAVAVQHTTTTTTQTDLFTQAAVVILTEIEGTFVVNAAGNITVQVAQNTSNASNTVALVGGQFELIRIA